MIAPVISAQFLRHLANCIELTGRSAEALLTDIGLERGDLDDVDRYVPLADYLRFIENCAVLIRNPQFGLMAGRLVSADAIGALSLLFLSAPNLRSAFQGFTRYLTLMQQSSRHAFYEIGDVATFEYGVLDISLGNRRQDAEYSVSATYNLMKQYCAGRLEVKEVFFEHACVGDAAKYEDYFGCDVYFEQGRNGIIFPSAFLDVRGKVLSDSLFPIIQDYFARKADETLGRVDFAQKLRQLLLSLPPGLILNRGDIARRLGLSVHMLDRRLRAQGLSLRAMMAQQRMAAAGHLLRNTRQSVGEIAFAVGYSESASFIRRFRAHFGVTPAHYRDSG
jgi:AraC-like DNA-binding protein